MTRLRYDILVEATDANGAHLGMPRLIVVFPEGVARVKMSQTSVASYARVPQLRVIDATPHPPPCTSPQGCVIPIR